VFVPLDAHYNLFVKALAEGRVTPFLGADFNLCGRPAGRAWQYGEPEYLPSHGELARHLAANFGYPSGNGTPELVRVSQYVAVTAGAGPSMRNSTSSLRANILRRRRIISLPNCPRCCRKKVIPRGLSLSSRPTMTICWSAPFATPASRLTWFRTSPRASTAANSCITHLKASPT